MSCRSQECLIILAVLSTICSSLVVSKASLRTLPLVKRFALSNVASMIKIDTILIHRLCATIWIIPASFEHKMAASILIQIVGRIELLLLHWT